MAQLTTDDLAAGLTHGGYGVLLGFLFGFVLAVVNSLSATPITSGTNILTMFSFAGGAIGMGYGLRQQDNSTPP